MGLTERRLDGADRGCQALEWSVLVFVLVDSG